MRRSVSAWIGLACIGLLLTGPAVRAAPQHPLGSAAWWSVWRAADVATKQTMSSRLATRGLDALKSICAERRASIARKDTLTLRDLDGLRQSIVNAWYRARTPKGMVFVPEGYVEVPRAKAPWGPSGERQHVHAFYMDIHEVTVEKWREWANHLLTETSRADDDYDDGFDVRKSLKKLKDAPARWPATYMTAERASQFAYDTCGGRLPRAEEFARALRGSGIARYPWGFGLSLAHANLRGYGPAEPRHVGRHPKGVTRLGIHDLVGNVAEWSAAVRPYGRVGKVHLALGGSYQHRPGAALTWLGSNRRLDPQSDQSARAWIGFRCVKDVEPLPAAARAQLETKRK